MVMVFNATFNNISTLFWNNLLHVSGIAFFMFLELSSSSTLSLL
jgi:hypothetical protein